MQATCPYCGEKFEKVNGTNIYCPHKNCQKEAAVIRQKKVDDLIKSFRKGIYANFKLFTEMLPNKGRKKLLLEPLLYRGFDEHGFYGSKRTKDDEATWHMVSNYYFRIIEEDGKKYIDFFKF